MEKAVIVGALKKKYPLPLLLSGLRFAKSSYYYQRKRKAFSEIHEDDRETVMEVFNHNHQRYGCRRIKIELVKTGRILSEKVIRRIIGENGMTTKGNILKSTDLT